MNKKTVWIIVGIVVIVGILIATSKKTQSDSFKIGVFAPLSGDYAGFGEKIKNGMEIARQEMTEKGKKVEVIYENGCLPKDAVSAVTKLVTVDKVDLIGGSFCLIGLIPSMPILEQNKVIAFNLAANPDEVLNSKNVVSTNFSIKTDAVKIATFITRNLGAKKVAIVYYDNDFGKSYQKHIHETLSTGGASIVFEQSTPHDEKDFRTILTRLKQSNPDTIALVEIGPSLAIFLKQAKELGISVPMVGYYENEDPTVLAAAGIAAEGFIISSSDSATQNSLLNAFVNKYSLLYGAQPDSLSLNAYDALHIEVSALEKCGKNYECLMTYFKSVKDYPGLSGTITIQEDGSAAKPTIFKVVKDGKFVPYNN